MAQARQLTESLLQRERRIVAMQTDAVMAYTDAGKTVKARETIVTRRPSQLRVEALSPFGVALVVAAQSSQLTVYDPSSNTFYRGASDAATLERFARIPLQPRQAVRLMMGLMPDDGAVAHGPDAVRQEGDMLVASYRLPGGALQELGFRNGLLAMVRLRDSAQGGYEVRYGDYQDIGGLQFPHALKAEFAGPGTRLELRYSHLIINPALADNLFVLMPGAGAKQMLIDPTAHAGRHG
jgi:hypothetical protein